MQTHATSKVPSKNVVIYIWYVIMIVAVDEINIYTKQAITGKLLII